MIEFFGGEILLDYLKQNKRCTEVQCAIILHQIAQGVKYMHDHNIVHRDLKLENLMFDEPGNIRKLKIIDFGFSKIVAEDDQLQTVCGSPQYVAPEILNSGGDQYTNAVDCWSTGVILFMLLSGRAPFGELAARDPMRWCSHTCFWRRSDPRAPSS